MIKKIVLIIGTPISIPLIVIIAGMTWCMSVILGILILSVELIMGFSKWTKTDSKFLSILFVGGPLTMYHLTKNYYKPFWEKVAE